jgi:hypothetical protein
MTQDKADPRIRKNIMIRRSAINIGLDLVRAMHKHSFSQLLEDLVRDAQQHQASGEDKNREQYLAEIMELLAKNRALEAKVAELKTDLAIKKSAWNQYLKQEADKKRGTQTT